MRILRRFVYATVLLLVAGFLLIHYHVIHLRSLPDRRASQASEWHTTTDWELKPSLKYDTLCLLNALSGDPFYLNYYKGEYDHFNPLFTTQERKSFQKLKWIIKDGDGSIISADLTGYFSTTPDETLEQMIQTTKTMSFWNSPIDREARPYLETALKALQRVGFTDYWEKNTRSRIEKRIGEIGPEMPKYNIVPAIEEKLGHPLSSNRITVFLLAYSEPHGIKLAGTRFITHFSYPLPIVLHNAVHELMHPPYDKSDREVASAVKQLGGDALVRDIVENHNRSFGYNSVSGYVEEDSVQALEEIVSEQFGLGRNPQEYWKNQDGGMHILAVAIYVRYKQALQDGKTAIPYQHWFVKAVRNGELQGHDLSETTKTFLAVRQ